MTNNTFQEQAKRPFILDLKSDSDDYEGTLNIEFTAY